MPIDHAHEQANKRVKGVGDMIGLTELPALLERWTVTGPEINRVVEQFAKADNDSYMIMKSSPITRKEVHIKSAFGNT